MNLWNVDEEEKSHRNYENHRGFEEVTGSWVAAMKIFIEIVMS